jgi:hypothetical protein
MTTRNQQRHRRRSSSEIETAIAVARATRALLNREPYYARRSGSRERKSKLTLKALTNNAGRQSARQTPLRWSLGAVPADEERKTRRVILGGFSFGPNESLETCMLCFARAI